MKITKNINTKNPLNLVGWYVFGILSATALFFTAIALVDPSNIDSPAGIISRLRGVPWPQNIPDSQVLIERVLCLMITFSLVVLYYYFGSEIYNEPKAKRRIPAWIVFNTKALFCLALVPFGAYVLFMLVLIYALNVVGLQF